MIRFEQTILRPPIESDVPFFTELRNNIELQLMMMARAKGSTAKQVTEWLLSRKTHPDSIFFVIAEALENKPIGFIQLIGIDAISQHAELGICVSDSFQGNQHARNALNSLEQYALNKLNISKITLQVLSSNQRAVAFYRKQGYRQVGYLCKHFYNDGSFCDVDIMEKIVGER